MKSIDAPPEPDERVAGSMPKQATQRVSAQPLSNPSVTRKGGHAPVAPLLSRLGQDYWFWEVGGMCLSLATILSICVILLVCDHQPVPKWRHGITLNAVISFLATLAKASLTMVVAASIDQHKWLWYQGSSRRLQDMSLFEEASRGPAGSLSLLFNRCGSGLFTWLAAATIVFALGLEPFIQQLVTYPLKNVPSSNQLASMRILSEIPGLNPDGTNFFWEPLGDRGQYNASIRTGIYDGASYLQTMPICPNGNCRWPRYHAIAFCSKCADVTNLTDINLVGDSSRTNLSDTIEQIILDAATNRTFQSSSKYPTEANFKITPPNGKTTNAHVEVVSWSGWFGVGTQWLGWIPWANGPPSGIIPVGTAYAFPVLDDAPITIIDTNHTHHTVWSLNFNAPLDPSSLFIFYDNNWINTTVAGIPGPLMAFGHLSMAWTGDSTERQLVNVQECALTPCVQEYEARVTNNTLFLDVLSTTYGYMSGTTSDTMGGWYAEANGTTFSISDLGSALSNMALWANALLTGSISQYSDVTCYVSNYTEAANFESNCVVSDYTLTTSFNDDLPASSEEMRAIDAQGNFSQVLTNVASSMTDLTRRFYNSRVLGDVLVAESFVNVRWIWLTLPVLLLLMSLFILSVTIYQNKHSKLALWKSSNLPWLYHGPDGMRVRSLLASSLNTTSSMEMDAGQIFVHLAKSEGAEEWKFRQMDHVTFPGTETPSIKPG